jgi:hypothetical protein
VRVVRVDEKVYKAILSHKHFLERSAGRRVSMNQALRSLLNHRRPGGFESLLTPSDQGVDRGADQTE